MCIVYTSKTTINIGALACKSSGREWGIKVPSAKTEGIMKVCNSSLESIGYTGREQMIFSVLHQYETISSEKDTVPVNIGKEEPTKLCHLPIVALCPLFIEWKGNIQGGGCSELCQLSCPGKGLGAALSWIITENTLIIAINWTIDLTLLRGLEASNYLTNPCQSMWWIANSLVLQRSTVAENRWCNWTLICDYVLCTLLAIIMVLVPTYQSTYWWDPSGIGHTDMKSHG